MSFILVGIGGAVGSILRFGVGLIPCKSDFPFITLAVNLFGAILIGFITGVAEHNNVSDNVLLFMKTGVCGGFTTFSTFSLESFNLFNSSKSVTAIIYIIVSVAFCLLGIFLGKMISRLTK